MEADGFLDLVDGADTGVLGGEIGTWRYGTGWLLVAHGLMMAVCKASGALGGWVEPMGDRDPQPSPEDNGEVQHVIGTV